LCSIAFPARRRSSAAPHLSPVRCLYIVRADQPGGVLHCHRPGVERPYLNLIVTRRFSQRGPVKLLHLAAKLKLRRRQPLGQRRIGFVLFGVPTAPGRQSITHFGPQAVFVQRGSGFLSDIP
jgi:hypothetical protein